jgi:hypothetical protein
MNEREKYERQIKLYETLIRYVGVRGILSCSLTIAYALLLIRNSPIPSEFYTIYGMVLGYYFARVSENGLLNRQQGENKNGKQSEQSK